MTFQTTLRGPAPSASTHAIWMIPELVRFIFGMLSQGELVKVITVSRDFWKEAAPQLWRDIHRPQLEALFPLGADFSVNRVSNTL